MLERETDTMIQILTERVIGSAKSLALKDALAANIPNGVKAYLHCEVTRWMQDDLRTATNFSSFQFTAPLVHKLTHTYTRTLALEYIFSRETFFSAMENAVHFVENYLCRPQWTLEHFAFEKSDRVSMIELQTRFEYLAYYLYYVKLVEGFMRQRGWQEIGVEDFRSLLMKIDDQIVKQHSPKELAQLTRPIFEFLLLKSEIANTPIPIKPLLVFFDDKKMSASKDYVERICHIRGWEQLTIEQLGEILEDLPTGLGNKTVPPENVAGVEPAEENQPHPDIQSQQEPDRVLVEPFTAAPKASQSTAPALGDNKRNIALSLTFSGMTESAQPPPPSPPPDLRTAINQEQRERFIGAIFQKDETYFTAVIEALNGMGSWKDASLYLQNFYVTTGLDPYLPDVVEFTDIVQLRYSQAPKP